jgi:uncharacterized protein
MNRLEHVRAVVDRSLLPVADPERLRCGFVHLYGVSATAILLARLRGLDEELAGIAGMLHDLVTYESGDSENHAARSAKRAMEILSELGGFTEGEIACIESSIAHHSDKQTIDGPYDEVLKDADVLQHDLYNPALSAYPGHEKRRHDLRQSLRADVTP